MEPVILVIHLFLAIGIIVLVLLQRSEGGGLGMGGGGLGGLSTAKGTANAMTKMTSILAAGFFITSLALGVMAAGHSTAHKGFLSDMKATAPVSEAQQGEKGSIEFLPPTNAGVTGSVPADPINIEVVPEETEAAGTKETPPVSAPASEEKPVKQTKPAAPVAE